MYSQFFSNFFFDFCKIDAKESNAVFLKQKKLRKYFFRNTIYFYSIYGELGWKDSNLRMAIPKTAALPLGDTPKNHFKGLNHYTFSILYIKRYIYYTVLMYACQRYRLYIFV